MSQFETTKLHPIQESGNEAQDILLYVYNALQAKGYDPTASSPPATPTRRWRC